MYLMYFFSRTLYKKENILEIKKLNNQNTRFSKANHHSKHNNTMPSLHSFEMFTIDGFEALVFTVCPVMVKPEVILSMVQKGNPSKSSSFHASIVTIIQDYSKAFLRTPRSIAKRPNETEMAAIVETLRQFAKDDFRYDLFKKNLHLVFELMTETSKQELHLLHNADLCKLLNNIQTYLRNSNDRAHWTAKYSPDLRKALFELHV